MRRHHSFPTSGVAYVFRTSGGAMYVEVAKLTADDAASVDQFGGSVAIDGDTIVVGATNDTDDYNSKRARPTSSARPTAPRTARLPS